MSPTQLMLLADEPPRAHVTAEHKADREETGQ